MFEFLTTAQNAPFSIALGVMFALAGVEALGVLLGLGVSDFLDSLLPDLDVDLDADLDVDVDADIDVDADAVGASGPGPILAALGWLRVGELPALVLLVLFLICFGIAGLTLQWALHTGLGVLLPARIAWVPAFLASIPLVRWSGGWAAKLIPKEETSAVSRETFVGREAEIVIGTARVGAPTQARLQDEHGRSHYVMVEPDDEAESFAQGERVLLVAIASPRFRIARAPR